MGNRLVYRTQDPAKIGEQVEERVRADLGSATRVPYEVHDSGGSLPGGLLGDVGRLMVGSQFGALATIVFKLPWHRPATLAVVATKVGITAQCASLYYEIDLPREVESEIGLQRKTFVAADASSGAVQRLNAVPELARRLDRVIRDRTVFGTAVIEKPSHFSIGPTEDGSRILIGTLARPTGLLMNSATTDAGEVVALARMIESAL